MADRAYNLPNANVHSLSYLNIHRTPIYSTLVLNDSSSKIQFLEPHNSDQSVEMPDATTNAGCIFWIENIGSVYNVIVYDAGQLNLIATLKPTYRTVLISDGLSWRASTSTPTGSATTKYVATINAGGDWHLDNTGRPPGVNWYYHDIHHNLGIQYLNVTCVDISDNAVIIPSDIVFTDENTTRIWMQDHTSVAMKVVLIG